MTNEKRLIDANAFWNRLNNTVYDLFDPESDFGYSPGIIKAVLDQTKTVDAVEVVHGEWVDKYEIKSFRHTNIPVVQCSKCECYFCDIINNHHFMYHYCPNCGAKMDGDGNA